MEIQVKVFAYLRDCLPQGTENGKLKLSLMANATVSEMISALKFERCLKLDLSKINLADAFQVMVNGIPESDFSRNLKEGDEVIIFPPLEGGRF
jgi:molybdopterin converting factor small subunit